MAKLPD